MDFINYFSSQKGYFRVFAFIVTNVPFSPTNEPVNQQMAENWLIAGLNVLPDEIGEKVFANDYNCSVIVYEFKAPDVNVKLSAVIPAKLSGKVHLEKSNIDNYLK